jgi:hypothetical protein
LLNVAKAQGVDFQQVLVRFALERILYRLSQSPHADRFLLKGALRFTLWYEMPHWATRDADLLGFGPSDLASVAGTFRDIVAVRVDDGIAFDPALVVVEAIRKDAGYGGVRVVITGELAKARCKTQIDVGFGDAVTPPPVDSVYPVLLAREALDDELLAQAITATFERRGMSVPAALQIGLSDEFAHDASRQSMWRAFLKRGDLPEAPLVDVVAQLRAVLSPAMRRAAA